MFINPTINNVFTLNSLFNYLYLEPYTVTESIGNYKKNIFSIFYKF